MALNSGGFDGADLHHHRPGAAGPGPRLRQLNWDPVNQKPNY